MHLSAFRLPLLSATVFVTTLLEQTPSLARGTSKIPDSILAVVAKDQAAHPEEKAPFSQLWAFAQEDDGGTFSKAMGQCGSAYKCTRNGLAATFAFPSGLHVTETYDKTRAPGQRVLFRVTASTGGTASADISPLVFDLSGNGIGTREPVVLYDLDGDGSLDVVRDFDAGNGVLALGRGRDGRELFGDVTDLDGDGLPDGYADGFEALAALVNRAVREGVLPDAASRSGRLGPSDLRALEEAYGLSVLVGGLRGRTISLADAGVAAIRLSGAPSRRLVDFDGAGDDVSAREGALFERTDGTSSAYRDVWLRLHTK